MIKAEIAMAFTSSGNIWECIFYGEKFDGNLAPKTAGEIDWGGAFIFWGGYPVSTWTFFHVRESSNG